MSTVKSKNLQVGTDATASNNFTIYQPSTPDGTLRIGVGNADSPTEVAQFNSIGNVGIGTASPDAKLHINGTSSTVTGLVLEAGANEDCRSIDFHNTGGNKRMGIVYDNVAIKLSITDRSENKLVTIEELTGNLKFNSGYGSVATAYGCRAWVNFNGQGTVAIRASGNVSSITDNGTGYYKVNFTTTMSDVNYATTALVARDPTGSNAFARLRGDNYATNGVGVTVQDVANNQIDPLICNVAIFR
tara:strand:- start:45 stop:779 length:735 start_codon:yes stop_codon:yes gene_type:complete